MQKLFSKNMKDIDGIDRKKIGKTFTIALAIGMFLLLGTKALAVSDLGFSLVGTKQLINDYQSPLKYGYWNQKIGVESDNTNQTTSHITGGILTGFDMAVSFDAPAGFLQGTITAGGTQFWTDAVIVSSMEKNIYQFNFAPGIDFSLFDPFQNMININVYALTGTPTPGCDYEAIWTCQQNYGFLGDHMTSWGSATDVFWTAELPTTGDYGDFAEGMPGGDNYFVLNTIYTPPPPPTCFTTNPIDNQTITGAFTINGECNDFGVNGLLYAHLVDQATNSVVFTNVDFIFEGTPFSIPVLNGVPVGDYDLQFVVRTSDQVDHNVDPGVAIHVIVELPPGIGGEPGTIIGAGIDPGTYYPGHSNYTTPTAFYTSITGTIAPLLGSLNNWGQSFMDRFSQTDAVANGTNIGNSLAIVRVYSSNINSLFNDFPVAQAIGILVVWYLALAVLTSIRFIVKLIK